VGSKGVHLLVTRDGNPERQINGSFQNSSGQANSRVNPDLGSLNYVYPSGWSTYNALQVNLSRQFSSGLTLQVNNTWQKCLDITDQVDSTFNGGLPQSNPWDEKIDYGPCGYNQTDNFHANAVYALPFKENKVVAGWQASLIASAGSGLPFSPWLGYDNANLNQQGALAPYFPERPNLNPGYACNSSLVTGNPKAWFKTAAFSAPTPGTLGDLPKNCLRGPGLFDIDFSLGKDTEIGDRLHALLRVDAFNVLNHTNFGELPGTAGSSDAPWNLIYSGPGVANPGAGKITSTFDSSRQIQASLRLQF
jgi:hypothetical protein